MNQRDFTMTSISRIRYAMENNRLVIFVGAGVSKNSGLPDWNDLVQAFASEIGFSNKDKLTKLLSILTDEQKEEFKPILSKIKNFSIDEYLKIPQYYSVKYGDFAYEEKVRKILKGSNKPNPIDYLIFDLNPVHIITTNYDNLLENAASLKGLNYSTVSNDKSLALADSNKLIIKMHGDFDKFVLKESDYDTYSNNFKLIETYVKGLIATNTILFVGFSADDANVRKIFQWIKDILGEYQNPAYILNIDDVKNSEEKEKILVKCDYLEKIKINTLFYDEIEKEIDAFVTNDIIKKYSQNVEIKIKPDNKFGLKLFKMLYYIRYQDENPDESNAIKYYYEILKELSV